MRVAAILLIFITNIALCSSFKKAIQKVLVWVHEHAEMSRTPSQRLTHVLQSFLPLFQFLHGVLQVSGGRHKLVFQLDHLFLQCLHLLLGLQQHTVYSHSAEPSPSPPASGWRSSASPGSGRGRSPAAASSSAAPSPPPPP